MVKCLSYCSVAMKRHCEHGNSYEKRHLIGGLLAISEVHPIIIMAGSVAACRCGAGAVAEMWVGIEWGGLRLEWAFEPLKLTLVA